MGCVHEIGLAAVCLWKVLLGYAVCWIGLLCLKCSAFTAAVMEAFERDVIIRQASALFLWSLSEMVCLLMQSVGRYKTLVFEFAPLGWLVHSVN